ncbi:MAG: hypothetical protein IKT02_07820, partial [Bacteroidales bacterium]|nr:hypothetical protein [Bacteroidales bacterium]
MQLSRSFDKLFLRQAVPSTSCSFDKLRNHDRGCVSLLLDTALVLFGSRIVGDTHKQQIISILRNF